MAYSPRLEDAFQFAHHLHRDQARKGVEIPYITHLLNVAGIVGDYGGNEEQVIAALLHDAAEDQGGYETLEQIRMRFGDSVAELVAACTDTYAVPKPAWRARKESYVARVRRDTPEQRLIVAADKLHNARSMVRDHRSAGEDLWTRFTASKGDTLWYYDAVLEALSDGWEHPILDELRETIALLHNLRP